MLFCEEAEEHIVLNGHRRAQIVFESGENIILKYHLNHMIIVVIFA